MNKFMAIIFALGAIGFFGLSQRTSYQAQPPGRYRSLDGEVQTVQITRADKMGYIVLGAVNMAACLYFVSRIRRSDLRR